MKGTSPYRQSPARALPFHYGWIIVGAAGIVGMVNASVRLSFGVFLDPLVESFGWSRGATSLAFSFQFISIGIFGVFSGWALEHYGLRRTMVFGSFLFALGMVLTGLMQNLWQFYLAYGVVVGAAMSFFSTPMITTVTLWFKKKRGLAGGMAWGLQGLGPVIMAPVLRYAISAFSWQDAFFVTGIAGAAIMLLMAWVVRSRPSDVGLLSYGQERLYSDGATPVDAADDVARIDEGRFFHQVSRTSTFWFLIIVHFLGCVSHSLIIVHIASMATFSGLSALVAAGVLSVLVATSVVSRFTMSVLTDVIGSKGVMFLAISIQATSILALFVISGPWAFYLFAAVFGIGYGGEMVGFPFINRKYYGSAPIGRIYGVQMLGAGLGMAAGGWAGGAIFDWTGEYTLGIAVAAITGFAALAFVFPVRAPTKKALEAALVPATAD